MTAKEYLSRAIYARRHVVTCMEQLADLRLMRGNISGQLGGEVHVSGGLPHSRVEDLAVKITEAERRLMQEASEWQEIYAEVSEAIGQVSVGRQQDVLRRRYLMAQSWEDIVAAYRPVDDRTVYRWHGAALKSVQELLGPVED